MGTFDKYFAELDERRAAQDAFRVTSTPTTPEQAAEALVIGKEADVPASIAAGSIDLFRSIASQKKASTALQGAPRMSEWLGKDPINGALSKDDLENLTWFERTFPIAGSVGRSVIAGGAGMVESAMRGMATQQKTPAELRALEMKRDGGFVRGRGFVAPEELTPEEQQRLEVLEMVFGGNPQDRPIYRAADSLETFIQERLAPYEDVAGSFWLDKLPQGIGSMLAFIASGPGMAYTGASAAAGQQYEDAIESGATEEDALRAADLGILVGSTEMVPVLTALKPIERVIPGARSYVVRALGRIARSAGEEAAQEALATTLDNLIALGIYDPERQVFEGVTEAASIGGIIGGLLGFGGRFRDTDRNEPEPPSGLGRDIEEFSRAGETSDALTTVDEMATTSKVRERAPDRFFDAMQDGGLGEQFVYLPAEQLRELFQTEAGTDTDTQLLGVLGVDERDYREQLAVGGEVTMPMSNYAAYVAGTPIADWVKQYGRLDTDEMTLSDAEQFNARVSEIMMEAFDRDEALRLEQRDRMAADERIRDDMFRQLRAAGRTPDVAEREAAVWGAFFRTMGERTGQGAAALAEAMGVRVQRAEAPQIEGQGRAPMGATPEPAARPAPVASRSDQEVAITASGREVPVRYKVVDAGDLVASQTDDGRANPAFPAELQPRDRSRGTSSEQIRRIAENLDPRLLANNPSAADGAPIVGPDNVVESGNGRVLAIRQAYANVPDRAAAYRDFISSLGYDVEGMANPVLVRERQGDTDRQAFTREANERSTMEMSDTERAMSDAAAMPDEILPLYRGGDVDLAQNREFVRAFISSVVSENDQGGMIDAQGRMSQRAVRRVQAALLAKAYGDATLVERVMEVTDGNIKAIGGALMDVAPVWAQMRREAAEGTIAPEMDQTEALMEAVNMIRRARDEGRPISEFVGQTDIFSGDAMSPMGEGFLRIMFRDPETMRRPAGRVKVADALGFYVEEAQKTSPGVDLLGETADPQALVDAAKEQQYGEGNTGPELFQSAYRVGDDYGEGGGGGDGRPDSEGADGASGRQDRVLGDLREDLRSLTKSGAEPSEIRKHPLVVEAEAVMQNQQATFTEEQMESEERFALLGNRTYINSKGKRFRGLYELMPELDRISESWAGEVRSERKAVILIGPPAAGKSTIAEKMIAPQLGARILDADEVKKLIPEYNGGIGAGAVHEESSTIAKEHIARIVATGDNIILPKVGDRAASIEKQIRNLKSAGYSVDLVLMDVEAKEAFGRMIGRFLSTGRLVVPDIAIAAGTKPPGVYQELKKKGVADGYALIDNNVAYEEDPIIVETKGPLAESLFGRGSGNAGADGSAPGATGEARDSSRTLFQDGDKRGSIQLPTGGLTVGETVINLFEKADLSTFLHESGHFFLEAMTALGDAPGAPDQIKTDLDTIRKYLGAKPGQTLTTKQHEQWARGFEAYLMEGKAPSLELADAFARFKAWLTRIYKSIAGLNVELTPEIREVMDRMLATDAEIAAARADMEMSPLFTEKAPGMTDTDWQTYQRMARRGEEQAQQSLLKRTMAKIHRERQAWYKDELAAVTQEVEDEINSQPLYRMTEALTNQRWLGDEERDVPDMRLDKQALIDQFGEGIIAELGRDKLGGKRAIYTTAKDEAGMSPQEAAEFFGFTDGSQLIEALQNFEKRDAVIAREAERRMDERHGDVMADGSIEEEALQAVHSEQQAMTSIMEARNLAERAGRDPKGMTIKAYRVRAKEMIGRMSVAQASRPAQFRQAERRAARKAQDALAKATRSGGEAAMAEALQAKEQQVLNGLLYDEARKVEEEVQKGREKMRSYDKKDVRAKLDGGYIEQIDAILEDYEFRKRTKGQIARAENLQAYIDRMIAEGREAELNIDERLMDEAGRKHYTRLSVDEIRGLFDTIANIDHMGRLKQKLVDAKKERDLLKVAQGVEAQIRDAKPLKDPAKRHAGQKALNLIRRPDTIMVALDDGKEFGTVYEALKLPIDEAQAEDQRLQVEMASRMDDLFKSFYDTKTLRKMQVERQITDGRPWSKAQIIAIALNTGNEANFQRLMDQNAAKDSRMDPKKLEVLLNELSQEDWKFVQAIWDEIDSYWGQLAAVHKRRTGVEPDKVQPKLMVNAPPGVRGGYYPIKYDPARSQKAARDEATAWDRYVSAGHGSTSQVANGMTRQREKSGGGRTLLFDLSVPFQHLRETVRYITMSEAVDNVYRVLNHPLVFDALQQTGNADTRETLNLWLQDTARGPIFNTDLLNSAARFIKNNFTLAKLAFNMKTVVLQMTGLGQSAVTIGHRNMARGMVKYLAAPAQMVQDVTERSAFMAERQTTFQKDIYDFMNDAQTVTPMQDRVRRGKTMVAKAGFWPMIKTQFLAVDMPTWLGAYDAALEQHGDEARAVIEADRMVARAQDSGMFADRAAFERGTVSQNTRQADFIRLFTTLGGYMLTKTNRAMVTSMRARADWREGSATERLGVAVQAATDMMVLFAFEAVAMGILYALMTDEEDDEDLRNFMLRETGMAVVGGIPLVRDAASAFNGYGGGGAYGSFLEAPADLFRQAVQGEADAAFFRALANLTGNLTGLPTTAATRLYEGAIGENDASLAEAIFGRNPLER